jgi:hypothetical protein
LISIICTGSNATTVPEAQGICNALVSETLSDIAEVVASANPQVVAMALTQAASGGK